MSISKLHIDQCLICYRYLVYMSLSYPSLASHTLCREEGSGQDAEERNYHWAVSSDIR